MTDLFLFLSVVVVFLTSMVTITRSFHFLQLNSYFNSRYFDYLKSEFKAKTVFSILGSALVISLAILNWIAGFIAAIITCAIRIWYTNFKVKTAKKKLTITGRVKRMYATLAVLDLALILVAFFIRSAQICFLAAGLIWLVLIPFVCMLVNLINAPYEYAAKMYYINDAKKILNSMQNLKVIGLTGSYGKTSTKHILGRILSEKYNTLITPGGINTPLGIVRTIREKLNSTHQIFVVEMGAKKLYDIKEICDIAHPTCGVLTSVGPQHLNTFGSIENVIKTKFELADEIQKNNGTVYLNFDNDYIKKQAPKYNYVSYGIENGEVRAKNIRCDRNGLSFDIVRNDLNFGVSTKLLGHHNVLNILGAAAIALDLGLSVNEITYAVARLEPVQHRLQMKPFLNGSVLIDDAYNANPEGSKQALSVLGSFAPMKRIVVTPGLVELGEQEFERNKELGTFCAKYADIVILVGIERSKPLEIGARETEFNLENLHIVKTFNDAAKMLHLLCDANTVVLFENDLPDNYAK